MTSASTVPYIGSKICLISNAGIRYEGILYNINTADSTVGLSNVRSFGTEGRKIGGQEVPPRDEIFDFIIFRGKDIKDLTVSDPAPPDDPAIVAINPVPTLQQPIQTTAGTQGSPTIDSQLGMHHMSAHPSRLEQTPYIMGSGSRPSGPPSRTPIDPHYTGRSMFVGVGRDDYVNRVGGNRRIPGTYYHHTPGAYMTTPNRRGGATTIYTHRGRGGNYGRGARRIIGELTAQPNQTLKSMVEEAFNFEEANSKFDKSTIAKEGAAVGERKENAQDSLSSGGITVKNVYDKKASFFDNISCETLDRQSGIDTKIDRTKQRQLDVETFGAAAAQIRSGRSGRIPRRGGLDYRRQMHHPLNSGPPPQLVGMGGIGGYQHLSRSTASAYQYGQPRY